MANDVNHVFANTAIGRNADIEHPGVHQCFTRNEDRESHRLWIHVGIHKHRKLPQHALFLRFAGNLLRRSVDGRKEARRLAFNKHLHNFFFIFEVIVDISQAIPALAGNISKLQLMESHREDAALGSINDFLAMLLDRIR